MISQTTTKIKYFSENCIIRQTMCYITINYRVKTIFFFFLPKLQLGKTKRPTKLPHHPLTIFMKETKYTGKMTRAYHVT